MPSASIDAFLACSIMIILVTSAMVGTSKFMNPYLSDLSDLGDVERFQQLASHLLQSTGMPDDWGQLKDTVPMKLGLAKAGSSIPHELDIDKVTRLRSGTAYSLDYSEIWQALGIEDISFQIEVKPLFEVTIAPVSNSTLGDEVFYMFEVTTGKSGIPIPANLSCYIVIKDYVNRIVSSTSSDGAGSISIGLPNSASGTALLLVFAQALMNPQIVSFQTYTFGHNFSQLTSPAFTTLSPLDFVLHVSLDDASTEILRAQVFTFNYNFTLAEKAREAESVDYFVPHLLDSSPMIMVLTGQNGSTSFAEWAAYPFLPLQIGADFEESTAGSRICSISNTVTIDSALYEAITRWGGAV